MFRDGEKAVKERRQSRGGKGHVPGSEAGGRDGLRESRLRPPRARLARKAGRSALEGPFELWSFDKQQQQKTTTLF